MIRTILFGAGTQATSFYNTEQIGREFIAVVDNNSILWGKSFFNLPILSPEKLTSLQYDQVVITTPRAVEVKRQLLEQLNVHPDKVFIPQQQITAELQAFRHQHTAALAVTLLNNICCSTELAHLDLMVDLNTLLLLQQQQGLGDSESTLHFSLPYTQLSKLAEYLPSVLMKAAPDLKYVITPLQKPLQTAIALMVEIEANSAANRRFSLAFRGRSMHNGIWVDLPSRGLFYAPAALCQKLTIKSFGLVNAKVPDCTTDYLNFVYDNWQTASISMPQGEYTHRGLKQAFASPPTWPSDLVSLFSKREDISIVSAVYNHQDTLTEALDSVLLQLSPYSIHIYCFDDASNDDSGTILRRYQALFSDRISIFTSPKNQGSGKKNFLFHRPDIQGRYWGFLAGDDFFLDMEKLYLQASYLDLHLEAIGCCCDTVLFEQSTGKETLVASELSRWNRLDLLLYSSKVNTYTHTSSILWRNIWRERRGFFLPAEFEKSYAFGDVMLSHMMLAYGGEMHRMKRTMSCYRYTSKGVWSSLTSEQQNRVQKKVLEGVKRATPRYLKLLQYLQPLRRKSKLLRMLLPGPLNEL